MSASVEERSLSALGADIEAGRTTSRELVAAYLERIERIDRAGPRLTSVIEINPDALAIAGALDAEFAAGRSRGPLHGIPVLIKDNIATDDGMETCAGSLALVGARPPADAHVVARLRAAGAVILGKTNMSEWANGRGMGSTSGWSARGGLTRNPYALDRSASGSSSGSAAAVAASLCAAAVGTETDGSIVSPASVCGIVGLKPTVGLISRSGIIPIAASFDTAGPMARSVRDCALLLGALAGADAQDEATQGACTRPDYAAALDADALRGARLGVARQFFAASGALARAYVPVLAALEAAGAVLVDPVELPDLEGLRAAIRTVLLCEMGAGVNGYLERLRPGAPVRSMADVIAFNRANAALEMPWFGQEIFEMAQAAAPLTDGEYLAARSACRRIAREQGIEAALRDHRLDALIAPTGGPAWCTDLVLGDHGVRGSSSPAAAAGLPGITVPAANLHGLPLGLSFVAGAWSEAKLLGLGYAFEQATRARRAPRYLPGIAA